MYEVNLFEKNIIFTQETTGRDIKIVFDESQSILIFMNYDDFLTTNTIALSYVLTENDLYYLNQLYYYFNKNIGLSMVNIRGGIDTLKGMSSIKLYSRKTFNVQATYITQNGTDNILVKIIIDTDNKMLYIRNYVI